MPSFLGMDLRGHLDLLLLATLRQTGPVHGYALIIALRDRSGGGVRSARRHRLSGPAPTGVGRVGGELLGRRAPRKRRIYTLTPAGEAAFAAKRTHFDAFVIGIRSVLQHRVVLS